MRCLARPDRNNSHGLRLRPCEECLDILYGENMFDSNIMALQNGYRIRYIHVTEWPKPRVNIVSTSSCLICYHPPVESLQPQTDATHNSTHRAPDYSPGSLHPGAKDVDTILLDAEDGIPPIKWPVSSGCLPIDSRQQQCVRQVAAILVCG